MGHILWLRFAEKREEQVKLIGSKVHGSARPGVQALRGNVAEENLEPGSSFGTNAARCIAYGKSQKPRSPPICANGAR